MPTALHASPTAVGVDRDAKAVRGIVVCQAGRMKSQVFNATTREMEWRGEWDRFGLDMLAALGNGNRDGIPSHFMHAGFECDGTGRFLGRVRSFRLSMTTDRDGRLVECVRGDLYLDRTALEASPWSGGKPFGVYLLDLLASDPAAVSSSIVVRPLLEWRRDAKGNKLRDANGVLLAPLWRPRILWAVDVVDMGDAVDALLRAEPSRTDTYRLAEDRLLHYRQMEREHEQFEFQHNG